MNDVKKNEQAPLERVVTRLVNPIGFVLAALTFLFVPCIATSAGSGHPELSWIADEGFTCWNIATEANAFPVAVRILPIALLVALVVGASTALAPSPQKRSFAAAITATFSGGLLLVTGLWASKSLDILGYEFLPMPPTMPPAEVAEFFDRLGIRVGVSLGFWLGLTALGVIIALNVHLVLRRRRRPATAVR
ncbi:hypothetical protein [Actinomadura sp. WAC 06369]|uniref:hypothetical protein n=1 Tax=Actinomadura sp. WAC 06369 TaxID=2203193 RepID=UPI000F7A6766|nr:hypothetical protein [Actinomadura sp. WAC 06369]